MKTCTKCNCIKNLEEFDISKVFKDGHNNWCKQCMKEYRNLHKNEMKEYNKIYRQTHKEELSEKAKIYHQQNKQKHNEQCKINYEKYHTQYHEEYLIAKKKYYQEHKDKWNEYVLNRRKSDLPFKILMNLRHRINMALKHNFKSKCTRELIGCSIELLKQHLEKQFKLDMTWENYGKWEIDHIRPCASFDLSKLEEQRKCFNYRNLQPLWKLENRTKGAKTCVETDIIYS